MSNRWLRFGIALLALGGALAAGARIFQQEQRLVANARSASSAEEIAVSALITIPEIKAALHAYVAEGQGHPFWTARAGGLIETLRASIIALDAPASAAAGSTGEALQLADRLSASEQRAREYARTGQRRLAGEVIFNDTRDVLDALATQVAQTRGQIGTAAQATAAGLRREQAVLALAAGGVLAFGVVLLVIPAARDAAPVAATGPLKSASDAAEDFESSARIISRTPIAKPAAAAAASATARATPSPTARPAAPTARPAASTGTPAASGAGPVHGQASGRQTTSEGKRDASEAAPAPSASAAATTTAAPASSPSLREAAAICTELARASQSIEVSNLLARAATVLDAAGAVVWMASADGRELVPAASAGYDERLLARIGAIPRTANNVTASAIRSGTPRTSPRVGQSSAALAIPLLTPLGAVGVLTAELKQVQEVDETRLAVATIFAAQLASLVGTRTTTAAAPAAGSAAKANAAT